jgi:1-deoxy-D-xylulose-5-phosphate synthase
MVLLSKVPGMTIFAPSSYQELQQMLEDALALTEGPTAIRWPKTQAPQVSWNEVGQGLAARQVIAASGPREVCLLGAGKMLATAVGAAKILEAEGHRTTVWDPRVIRPLDSTMLDDAGRHPLVVTVEDGLREGGFGTAVRDTLADTAPDCRVAVLGVPLGHHRHGRPDELLASFGLDPAGVAIAARNRLS